MNSKGVSAGASIQLPKGSKQTTQVISRGEAKNMTSDSSKVVYDFVHDHPTRFFTVEESLQLVMRIIRLNTKLRKDNPELKTKMIRRKIQGYGDVVSHTLALKRENEEQLRELLRPPSPSQDGVEKDEKKDEERTRSIQKELNDSLVISSALERMYNETDCKLQEYCQWHKNIFHKLTHPLCDEADREHIFHSLGLWKLIEAETNPKKRLKVQAECEREAQEYNLQRFLIKGMNAEEGKLENERRVLEREDMEQRIENGEI